MSFFSAPASAPLRPMLLRLLAGVSLFGVSAQGAAVSEPPFVAKTLRPFLESHCTDCHDDTTQKGNMRLDNLAANFAQPDVFNCWLKVLDELDSGEMPPKKKPRPAAGEMKAVTDWLRANLQAASLARQQGEGRTSTRRLSRVEYENTVRDLLGIDTELSDLLPEDPIVNGFDNGDASVGLSPVLMERYLEAAEIALDAAIANDPQPETKSGTYTFKPKEGGDAKTVPWNAVVNQPDAVVYLNTPPVLPNYRTPSAGNYRLRIHAYGYQTNGKPITYALYTTKQYQGTGDNLVGYYQAPGQPGAATVEVTTKIGASFNIKFAPEGQTKQQLKEPTTYTGPGLAIQSVDIEGPLNPEWPPASHKRIFGDAPLESLLKVRPAMKELRISPKRVTPISKQPEQDTERIVRDFLPRAFRRPVPPEEAQVYVKLALDRLKAGATFEDAVRMGLKAALCSPSFLLRNEKPGRLDDYALATRLSYFFWSTMPDEELFGLAAKRQLSQPAVLRAQVERMLKSPKGVAFTENFAGQWLGLRLIDFTTPDKKLYPEFDAYLQESMLKETQSFFNELLTKNLSTDNFIQSDFAFLNERLAKEYGIAGIEGVECRKVPVGPETHRGGVLTQGAILKITANGTNTSPVIRGNWVLKNIMGREVPPPPKAVAAIEPDIRGAKTIREQLDKHRSNDSCAACHAKMDPPGFALESFDVIGGWRENYRSIGEGKKSPNGNYKIGPAVDCSGTLPGDRAFANIDDLKKLLLADHEQVARNVAEKLLTYATGHRPEYIDRPAIQGILDRSRASKFGLRTLIHEVVESPTFLNR